MYSKAIRILLLNHSKLSLVVNPFTIENMTDY